MSKILIVGAGMAGSEAAFYLASKGHQVVLAESKRLQKNPAQKSDKFAELVCTNSLKSVRDSSAHGLLKKEMKALGSVILAKAQDCAVPAGDALAVDREQFSTAVTQALLDNANIQVVDRDIADPMAAMVEYGCSDVILSSGPLTNPGLESWIQDHVTKDDFYFYDAIAPVVDADSLDYSKLYYKDRYKDCEESADYLNCPLDEAQYYAFVEAMATGEKTPAKDFEEYKFFEACLPIDLMAERGADTPRFSCMKPLGLELSKEHRPFAVVQLRKENLLGSAFNLVGFQTRLTYKEQLRIFRTLPGFENASFIHLGSVHRNSYLNSRKHLNWDMSSQSNPHLHFAGQITGVEGYTESAASGLYVAWQLHRKLSGKSTVNWPVETIIGSMINYVMTTERPVPSNVNFGLLPQIELTKEQRKGRDKKELRKELVGQRAAVSFNEFITTEGI